MNSFEEVKNGKREKLNKIVINDCYGGFKLSKRARAYLRKQPEVIELMNQDKNFDINSYFSLDENRTHPALIRCIEILGKKASDSFCSKLVIKKFKGNKYRIDEYDGWERIETPNTVHWITKKPSKPAVETTNETANNTLTHETQHYINRRMMQSANVRQNNENSLSIENMTWVVSKYIPSEAIGCLELKNGIQIRVTCSDLNMEKGPYKLSIVCRDRVTDIIPQKDITSLLIKNHKDDRKYSRQQVEKIMNTLNDMPRHAISRYCNLHQYNFQTQYAGLMISNALLVK